LRRTIGQQLFSSLFLKRTIMMTYLKTALAHGAIAVSVTWLTITAGVPAVLAQEQMPPSSNQVEEQEQAEEEQETAPRLDRSLKYTIQPMDKIRVMVWREPELTGDYLVRLDGQVTVPLLGDIPAAGRAPAQLSLELREKMQTFLERPVVAVAVVEANSARFFVIGQVGRSGVYPMFGRTTILQALALAGGFREFAKRDRIVIIRQTSGQMISIPFNYKSLEGGKNLEQNIALEPGDTVVVP
jgi:polysaccharide export outer membrane protein